MSGAFVAWLSGALKESQLMMISTLRSIGDAVIATDRRGSIRFMNPAAEALTGWSSREATGRSIAEVYQVVDAETELSVSLPLLTALQNAFALPKNAYLISKSGDRVCIYDSLAPAPVHVDSGKALGATLFEPFFTTREAGKGSGLGLSIVFGIVNGHNGRVTVESQPGQGSVFRVYFPRVDSLNSWPAQDLSVEAVPRSASIAASTLDGSCSRF
jgi:PAS domain S-box-containing protein